MTVQLRPLHRGWTVAVIVASGPSLTDEQVATARAARDAGRCRSIVVNDNWTKWPDADVLYACDDLWWDVYAPDVALGFKGQRWTQSNRAARAHGLNFVDSVRNPGLTNDPARINVSGNGGHQAINLAYLFGARRIVVVGFDCQRGPKSKEHPQGKVHWFGSHPRPKLSQGEPSSWIPAFKDLARDAKARGVTILNASRETALTCFPRVDLAEALQ